MGIKGLKESDIKRYIIRWFDFQKNCLVWVNTSTGIYDAKIGGFRKLNGAGQRRGVADILGIWKGRPLAIEVKRPGGKITEDQARFLAQFNAAGGIGFVARSVDDVIRMLQPPPISI
jgi:hypothetical protein